MRSTISRLRLGEAAVVALLIAAALTTASVIVAMAFASPARAATPITVTTANDEQNPNNECSLREAIVHANDNQQTSADCAAGTGAEEDTIEFAPSLSGQTISLASDLPTITDIAGLTIDGSSADITVDGLIFLPNGAPKRLRVFGVGSSGKLAVDEIDVEYGLMPNNSGTLAVSDSTFSSVSVQEEGSGAEIILDKLTMTGGTIGLDGGTLTVRDSTFSQNENAVDSGDAGIVGHGGAIYNEGGTLTVSDSTFFRNLAASGGGAIYNSGTLTVSNSFFHNNAEAWFRFNGGFNGEFCFVCGGGGIYNHGTATVINSIIFGNASQAGGGIFNDGALTVSNSTFFNNRFGGGGSIIIDPGSSATLRNTIVAAGCDGTITNGGHNLDSGTSCGFGASNNSLSGEDPVLGSLADNGGPTLTHALLEGSPAIDSGNPGSQAEGACTDSDQRGVPRKDCDIGSYEYSECGGAVVNVVGTPGPDVLEGGEEGNAVLALGGKDRIEGMGGDDAVCAGRGADTLDGGDGDDRLFGSSGNDRLDTRDGVRANDLADGGSGKGDVCKTDPRDKRVRCE